MPFPEWPAANDRVEARIVLTDEELQVAAHLLRKLTGAAGSATSNDVETAAGRRIPARDMQQRQDLIARARLLLHARSLRERYFNRAIFGEPAWEILLVLYVTDFAAERQTIGRLAEWIETPPTTVLRWLGYLEKERLVARQAHPTDRRIFFIRLLDKGRDAIEGYLAELPR